jgi:transcriptional regulator with XRE-family HTH domain
MDKLTRQILGSAATAHIGADLRKKRKERGFSLKEVAERMGISMPYLSDLERGNRRWSDNLKHIFENAIKPKLLKGRSAR